MEDADAVKKNTEGKNRRLRAIRWKAESNQWREIEKNVLIFNFIQIDSNELREYQLVQ